MGTFFQPQERVDYAPPNVIFNDLPQLGEEGYEEEELTDEELRLAVDGQYWCPPGEEWSSEVFEQFGEVRKRIDIPSLYLSQFTEFAFYMPDKTANTGYSNFSFEGRRHMIRPYNTAHNRILLFCGRQVEKSTFLGNTAIGVSCMKPAHRTLYVSPSATQTRTFSLDRIKEPIETSPVLRSWTTSALMNNVFEKQFVNRSKVTMRYAFLNADRTRGIPADKLLLDEMQDILVDNIPVIEQCTSHADESLRSFLYAGTPKGMENPLEYYRSNFSTQGEWVVPCDRCGSTAGAGRFWNILGESNIGKKSLICAKCGQQIHAMHEDAQWAFGQPLDGKDVIFESYRIPQLMVPWKPWNEILIDYKRYPRDKFYNEVLGLSYDSGLRPLTQQNIKDVCNSKLTMHPKVVERFRKNLRGREVFAGVDWGCHDDQTRILTEDGFKYFKDLTDDDKVAQWDPDTREMTFVVPKARTVRDWDKPLLHFETRGGMDLMVTHTHRMRVGRRQGQAWSTESAGETAKRGGHVHFVGHVKWAGAHVEEFTLPGLPVSSGYQGCEPRTFSMNKWLEFMGYFLTEGGICLTKAGKPYCLKMSQRATVHPDEARSMVACMTELGIPFSEFPNEETGDLNWTINGKQYWAWFAENTGMTCDTKRIPRWALQLSYEQLLILFDALMQGDGSWDSREGTNSGSFYSTSKGLCEDFQELCIKLGLRCHVSLHKEEDGNRKARYRASWSTGRDFQFNDVKNNVKYVPYNGKVYCCAVPTGYIITERNGKISYQGNTGENTYTVLTLGCYEGMKFRIFYVHRFVGEDTDPEKQVAKIIAICHAFQARMIGADYGGGFDRNYKLVTKFGTKRVQKFQYAPRPQKKVEWKGKLMRWIVHRTEVMSDLFNAIKRGKLEFPRWEEFYDPYAKDMLSIYSSYNHTLRMIVYDRRPDQPDDTFHSVLYCFLAACLVHPRPDVFAATREDPLKGVIIDPWTGPTYQG